MYTNSFIDSYYNSLFQSVFYCYPSSSRPFLLLSQTSILKKPASNSSLLLCLYITSRYFSSPINYKKYKSLGKKARHYTSKYFYRYANSSTHSSCIDYGVICFLSSYIISISRVNLFLDSVPYKKRIRKEIGQYSINIGIASL